MHFKNKKIALLSFCMMASGVQAGMVGAGLTSTSILFVGLEGSYTGEKIQGFTFNSIFGTNSRQGGGGRASVGILRTYKNNTHFTAEAGWGYYGKSEYYTQPLDSFGSYTMYGFDLLFGVDQTYRNVDLFIKAGAMAEMVRFSSSTNLERVYSGGFITGTLQEARTDSNVVPEIKVGGIYNINDQLGISLAYMYLVGWEVGGSATSQAAPTGIIINKNTSSGPPAFNSVLLGVRYNFI